MKTRLVVSSLIVIGLSLNLLAVGPIFPTITPAQKLQQDTQKLIMLQQTLTRGTFQVAGSTTTLTLDSTQTATLQAQITALIAVVQTDAEALGQ